MKRFRNILFIADQDEGLQVPLERAIALARSNEARLTVMDVTPDTGLADYFTQAYGIDLNEQLRERRLQSLDALIQPYLQEDAVIYTKVETGTAFLEIIGAVHRNGHDLVMKVAEHSSGLARTLFGSTDMHLLRKCPCPVWIHPSTASGQYQRIVAAVDPFDDESGELQKLILGLATSLAEREQAELDILHAWQLPGESMLRNGRGRIADRDLESMLKLREQHHSNGLNELLSHHDLDTASENVHLIKGPPAQVIGDFASAKSADLIVMGTIGRTGVPGLIIGNTAEDVLRETQTVDSHAATSLCRQHWDILTI